MKNPAKLSKNNSPRQQAHYRIPADIKKQINFYSMENNISENAVVVLSLQSFFAKDIAEENLIIAKLSNMDRKIEKITTKLDLANKFNLDLAQYQFIFHPSLPEDLKSLKLSYKTGAQKFKSFLTMFKKRLKAMPSLEESVLGDSYEKHILNKGDSD